MNEFALYLDKPGMYDFYLGAKEGDYEFLVDNNPASVASGDHMVTLELQSGLHTFQIFTGFSGSGRDTSWSVGIVPVAEFSRALSREATLATWLLGDRDNRIHCGRELRIHPQKETGVPREPDHVKARHRVESMNDRSFHR